MTWGNKKIVLKKNDIGFIICNNIVYTFRYKHYFTIYRNNGKTASFWLKKDDGKYMASIPITEYQEGKIFDSVSRNDLLSYHWAREEREQLLSQLKKRKKTNDT